MEWAGKDRRLRVAGGLGLAMLFLLGFFNLGRSLFLGEYAVLVLTVFLVYFLLSFKEKYAFLLVGTSLALYGLFFIFASGFEYRGVRYFTLFDDAMISMRYAKNLVAGYGLVWNPSGIRVEGYTNFLWTLYMAFWHLFPFHLSKMALPIELSGLVFLLVSLFFVKKITLNMTGSHRYASVMAVALTAVYYPNNFWALRGMETSFLSCLILWATWRIFKVLENKRFDPFLFIVLGLGLLARMDFFYLYISMTFFCILADRSNRFRNILMAGGVFLVFFGGQMLFRGFYYGTLLPNTYYLKMTGFAVSGRMATGLDRLIQFIVVMSPFIFFAPVIYGLAQRKNIKVVFLLVIFLLQILYSIYVGGDAWEWWGHLANRYISVVMPLFFILISCLAAAIAEWFGFSRNVTIRAGFFPERLFFAFSLVLVMFQTINSPLILCQMLRFTGLHVRDDANMVKTALALKEVTRPDATIAVVWAGSIPYFSDRPCVDLLGKNDPFVARLPAREKMFKYFYPGHNKYYVNYSIGTLKPDVVAQLWRERILNEAAPWLKQYYIPAKLGGNRMYFRKDSKNILWDKLSISSRVPLG